MKYFRLLIVFSILWNLSSCSKMDIEEDLIGEWKLVEVSGGFTGGGYPSSVGYLTLKEDKKCVWSLRDKQELWTGTYAITESGDKVNIKFVADWRVLEEMPPSISIFVSHKKTLKQEPVDKLVLFDPCCDLYSYNFEKE